MLQKYAYIVSIFIYFCIDSEFKQKVYKLNKKCENVPFKIVMFTITQKEMEIYFFYLLISTIILKNVYFFMYFLKIFDDSENEKV